MTADCQDDIGDGTSVDITGSATGEMPVDLAMATIAFDEAEGTYAFTATFAEPVRALDAISQGIPIPADIGTTGVTFDLRADDGRQVELAMSFDDAVPEFAKYTFDPADDDGSNDVEAFTPVRFTVLSSFVSILLAEDDVDPISAPFDWAAGSYQIRTDPLAGIITAGDSCGLPPNGSTLESDLLSEFPPASASATGEGDPPWSGNMPMMAPASIAEAVSVSDEWGDCPILFVPGDFVYELDTGGTFTGSTHEIATWEIVDSDGIRLTALVDVADVPSPIALAPEGASDWQTEIFGDGSTITWIELPSPNVGYLLHPAGSPCGWLLTGPAPLEPLLPGLTISST